MAVVAAITCSGGYCSMTMGITVCAWAVRDGTYHNHDEEISSSCEIVRLIVFILLKGKVKLVGVYI